MSTFFDSLYDKNGFRVNNFGFYYDAKRGGFVWEEECIGDEQLATREEEQAEADRLFLKSCGIRIEEPV
jgi:hypothetical protein